MSFEASDPPRVRRPWQRLDLRIVAIFLGLLLLVQLLSFVAIRETIDVNAQRQINAELATGEAVLRRLLAQNAQKLTEGARLLSADFGFRSAIASDDQATILDALDNQRSRIGAAAAIFTDAQHNLVASTVDDGTELLPLVRANLRAAADGSEGTVRVYDGRPYQLVTVAVRAPRLIGNVSMGFPLSSDLVTDLEHLSPLRLALLVRAHGAAGWTPLPLGDRGRSLADAAGLALTPGLAELGLAGERHRVRVVPLAEGAGHDAAALLMRSVDEAVAPYRQLQLTMLLITLGGVGIFAAGSFFTARRVTGPIQQLSASAERLREGDYSAAVVASSNDEVGDLARSFEAMRQAMQRRDREIRRLAYWDRLTGLPNRERLRDRLQQLLAPGDDPDPVCAVLIINLDRFKSINDVLGHAFGDRVLREISRRLSGGSLRKIDLLARLSGDGFAICLPQADAGTAQAVAQRIRALLDQPLVLDDQTVDVSASIGIAISPAHGREADTLLGHAEMAMYKAKERRAELCVYEPSMDTAGAESLSLLSEMRLAAEHDQFRLFLQPKVALSDGRVLGAEALVRWQHPTRGLVPPMQFVPFAEQSGFIRTITAWMIERCAKRGAALRRAGMPLKFAVNLSARDLIDQDLSGKVQALADRGGLELRALTLEITESAIMDDPQRALATLQRLREMGLRLSIDDFGTGYSSLAYLKRLPLDELKIDRSFVMSMHLDPADLKIVRSTIDLAHNLGLSVVAEGIEDRVAWQTLQAMGCDEGQGYFIGKPIPEAEFEDWVLRWQASQPRAPQPVQAPAARIAA